ncbi:MAG: aminoglycoside phosphotransferase family protein [Rickettsiales bacterium]|nr:aminoglycoside phosphotransferase family protein [Rickettsiales bacterium]
MIAVDLVYKIVAKQFPEFVDLPIVLADKQGHDNYTFRLGKNMLIRMPTQEYYALAVEKEQKFLPLLSDHLTVNIPVPLRIGVPSREFNFPFSIYKWLDGKSCDQVYLNDRDMEKLASDLAKFLKELQSINLMDGPLPGQHNWWRGDHISVYDKNIRKQIAQLSEVIDVDNAISFWKRACKTKWNKPLVWVHGDLAKDNILIKDNKLFAIIDFGCVGIGDPACDLVIAWTFLKGKSRERFISEMALDDNTWLRAKAWALWKASFELCQIDNKNVSDASIYKEIIETVLH